MPLRHHGATPGRHHDRSARSIAGRGRKGLRLIPRSQPIPEARPQPEIAARSAGSAPRTRSQGCAPKRCKLGLARLIPKMRWAPRRTGAPPLRWGLRTTKKQFAPAEKQPELAQRWLRRLRVLLRGLRRDRLWSGQQPVRCVRGAVRLEQQHGALLGQRGAGLIERQREDRHIGFVQLPSLCLLNGDAQDRVSLVLQLVELFDRVRPCGLSSRAAGGDATGGCAACSCPPGNS